MEDIYKIMKTGLLDILKESINEGGVKKDLYTTHARDSHYTLYTSGDFPNWFRKSIH